MPICYYCGALLQWQQKECPNCGRINEADEEAQGAQQPAPKTDQSVAEETGAETPQPPTLSFEADASAGQGGLNAEALPYANSAPPQTGAPGYSAPADGQGGQPVQPEAPFQQGNAPWPGNENGPASAPEYPAQGAPPVPAGYGPLYTPQQMEDIAANKNMAILAYLGILILVPAISMQHSPFVKFHLNQALVLLIASVILTTASSLLGYFVFYIFTLIVSIVWLVFWIMGIYNAATGKYQPLPLIGSIQLVKY